MANDTSGLIDIDARALTDLTEQMHKICAVKDEEKKEIIEKLAREIHSKYNTDISKSAEKEKEKNPAKEEEKENMEGKPKNEKVGFLKSLVKKIFSEKTPEEKAIAEAKAIEEKRIAEIENRIALATNRLRSNQAVDSAQNDLNIMKDMVEVVEIASDAKVPAKVAEEARQAIGKVSLITGGSENTVKQETARKQKIAARTGVSNFMRQNLEGNTTEVTFGPPVTPGQKEIENANYEKDSAALAERDRKNQK